MQQLVLLVTQNFVSSNSRVFVTKKSQFLNNLYYHFEHYLKQCTQREKEQGQSIYMYYYLSKNKLRRKDRLDDQIKVV